MASSRYRGSWTITGHARARSVSYLTARKDLQDLEAQGLSRRLTAGKTHEYVTTDQVRRALTR